MKAFSSPNYSRNADRVSGSDHPCAICGKAVSTQLAWTVRLDTDYNMYDTYAVEVGENMGCFFIGPECRRKYPEVRAIARRYYRPVAVVP